VSFTDLSLKVHIPPHLPSHSLLHTLIPPCMTLSDMRDYYRLWQREAARCSDLRRGQGHSCARKQLKVANLFKRIPIGSLTVLFSQAQAILIVSFPDESPMKPKARVAHLFELSLWSSCLTSLRHCQMHTRSLFRLTEQ